MTNMFGIVSTRVLARACTVVALAFLVSTLAAEGTAGSAQEKRPAPGRTGWTDHEWVLRWGPRDRDRDGVIFNTSKGASNTFRLVAHPDDKDAVYYTVKSDEGAMTPYWARCKFFPRGLAESQVWPRGEKLLPRDRKDWSPNGHPVLYGFGAAHTVNSRRLEGDFEFKGKAQAVTLWIVEQAKDHQKGPQPLLVVDVRDVHLDQVNESGTGTGDPK